MSTRRLLFLRFTTEVECEAEPLAAGAQVYIIRMISLLTVTSGYESLPEGRTFYANPALHFARRAGSDARVAAAGRSAGRAAASRVSHRAHRAARRRRRADGAMHPAVPQG